MDEEAFQKMVERQYDLLKKERMKNIEEQKTKTEENGTRSDKTSPPPEPSDAAAEVPVSEQSHQQNGQTPASEVFF